MLLSLDYSSVVAALEDRIRVLIKKFPLVPEEYIRFLSTCDPSGGKYLEYLVSQKAKGILTGGTDEGICRSVQNALKFYMMVNQSKKVKEHLQKTIPALSDILTEISRINVKYLYGLAEEYDGDVKVEIRKLKGGKSHGKVIYQDDTYKIIVFKWDPSMDWNDLISEVCVYSKGKWCTQHRQDAEDYLSEALYVVFKDGKSLLQTDQWQFKDVYNKSFNFQKYPDLAIILVKTGVIKLWKKTQKHQSPNQDLLGQLDSDNGFLTDPVRQYLTENDFM